MDTTTLSLPLEPDKQTLTFNLSSLLDLFVRVDEDEGRDDVRRHELVVDEDVFEDVGEVVEKVLRENDTALSGKHYNWAR